MDNFYKIGVIAGIIVVYSFATWGLAAAITTIRGDNDDFFVAVIAWSIGIFAFMALAIFTLTKFNLWGSV